MTVKRYSAFHGASGLEPHHQIYQCHIQDTRWRSYSNTVGVFHSFRRLRSSIIEKFEMILTVTIILLFHRNKINQILRLQKIRENKEYDYIVKLLLPIVKFSWFNYLEKLLLKKASRNQFNSKVKNDTGSNPVEMLFFISDLCCL